MTRRAAAANEARKSDPPASQTRQVEAIQRLVGSTTASPVHSDIDRSSGLEILVGSSHTSSNSPDEDRFVRLRRLVGASGPSRSRTGVHKSPELRSSVGAEAERLSASGSSNLGLPHVADASGDRKVSPPADLAELVGEAVPRRDDRGWMAPELAQPGRRPRLPNGRRGTSIGILNVVVAVVAVAMLAGTASLAVIQRAAANPAAEAMVSLREREGDLRNEIKSLQTSTDLLSSVVQEATGTSASAAQVLPTLDGRVEPAPLAAAQSARGTLDAAVSSVPQIAVPEYSRGAMDERSLEDVGEALDDVRRVREALPPLTDDVRTARSNVAAALDEFRARLRDLGSTLPATAGRLAETQDAAEDSFRDAVASAAASVTAAQQSGADGFAEMAAFASAVDALNTENSRVLEQLRTTPPVRTPSVRSTAPTSPSTPGNSSTPAPSAPAVPEEPTTPEASQPAPAPSGTTTG